MSCKIWVKPARKILLKGHKQVMIFPVAFNICNVSSIERVPLMTRIDGRIQTQLRPVRLTIDYLDFAEGSVLIEAGKTRVLCAASIEERVPPFLEGTGRGWVTAEYTMLPRATHTPRAREPDGRISGRTQEFQRLIGRSLRAVLDMNSLGPRTITPDCDSLQSTSRTRTPPIT